MFDSRHYWANDLTDHGFFFTTGKDEFYPSLYPKFPEKVPETNYLKKHLEIYRLIEEFMKLHNDLKTASDPAKKLIEPRLEEIAKTLARDYFVVTRDELR